MRYLLVLLAILICGCETPKAKPEPKVLLYAFGASWCGPCRVMHPVLDSIENKGYLVRPIDVDNHPEFAAKFDVQNLPTYVVVRKGREVGRVVGVTSEQNLLRLLRGEKKKPAMRQ